MKSPLTENEDFVLNIAFVWKLFMLPKSRPKLAHELANRIGRKQELLSSLTSTVAPLRYFGGIEVDENIG